MTASPKKKPTTVTVLPGSASSALPRYPDAEFKGVITGYLGSADASTEEAVAVIDVTLDDESIVTVEALPLSEKFNPATYNGHLYKDGA